MKTLILALAVGLLTVSCDRHHEPYQPLMPRAAAAEPTNSGGVSPAVEKMVRERGDQIAKEAFGVLNAKLGKAIADAGLTNAIEVCSVHGIAIPTAVGETNRVTLRRVTHRPRNPQNQATPKEVGLIETFESELEQGTKVAAVVTTNDPDIVSYYSPIVLKLPFCLSCHGQPGTDIAPEVLAQIRQSYPADQAKGFSLGEVRGLWRIDFKASDLVQP